MTWVRRVWEGRGDGEYGFSGQREILFSIPVGVHLHVCPICVCVFACSHIIHLLNNMSLLA